MLAVVLAFSVGCATVVEDPTALIEELRQDEFELFFLEFDDYGQLVDHAERNRARDALEHGAPFERVIVLCHGWGGESRYEYAELLSDYVYTMTSEGTGGSRRTMVLAVLWDSSISPFRDVIQGVLPLPIVSDVVGFVPELVTFPFTFWSRAAAADRIGRHGLHRSLAAIFDGQEAPPIVMVGHSFGCRVLSQSYAAVEVAESRYGSSIGGMVLLQGALSAQDLPSGGDFPVVVVQSRHDHALGFAFPIANIPLNASTSTIAADAVGLLDEPIHDSPRPARFGLEIVRVPLSLAISFVALPLDYVQTQLRELGNKHLHYFPETLAQLPVAEIVVDAADALTSDDSVPWNASGRGPLNAGAFTAANGSVANPDGWRWTVPDLVTLRQFNNASGHLLESNAVIHVDASNVIRTGSLLGIDYDMGFKPWDYTIAWLDPIGAHGDHRRAGVYRLIDRVVQNASR